MELMEPIELKTERLLLMIEPSLAVRIDDYRYENRIPSRAAAVRELMLKSLPGNEKAETVTVPAE